ncbi:hypothetical protein jhhlp_008627 [Lomentospora prolificans]|uniref:Carbohydrate kinase PfkB domain-containing protein n=1 Tax=Lomentospora prolificans TaxID=41688 RepID=A0A2N3MYJ8_9PEZI|nr:hypothetical protein jhhlp_008627 [Lomentospora prolificans]
MQHIFLVGACYVDTILSVPFFPQEDSKLRAQSLTVRRGGNCPNSLEVLRQLLRHAPGSVGSAARTHLVSCLPDAGSVATARIKASFGAEGDDDGDGDGFLGSCIYREGVEEPASSFIVRSLETGSRTIVNYNGLEEMTAEEFRAAVEGFRKGGAGESWWHFEVRC